MYIDNMNIETKTCRKCNLDLKVDNFYKSSRHSDGLQSWCKSCKKESAKIKYNTNYDFRIEYNEKRRGNKRNSIMSLKYHNERYKTDPSFAIAKNMRSRLRNVIIRSNTTKIETTVNLIGCSFGELKEHLENRFLKGMTFKNYGKVWEIDHIKPCASFDLTKKSEQRKCFHYSNLQPLFATTDIAIQHGHMNEIGNRNKQHKLI